MITCRDRQAGLSLVELMVAMTIGLLMMGGIFQVLMNAKDSSSMTNELGRLQESARFSTDLLSREIRMAGYFGCTPATTCPPPSNRVACANSFLNLTGTGYSDTLYALTDAVGGWEYTGTGVGNSYTITTLDPTTANVVNWSDRSGANLISDLQNMVVPGTDILVVKYLSAIEGVTPNGAPPLNAEPINITNSTGTDVPAGTIIAVSDCLGSDIFQNRTASSLALSRGTTTSASSPGPGNLITGSGDLAHGQESSTPYTADTEILQGNILVFYIGISTAGHPTLFRVDFNLGSIGTPVEIAEGVENMQILYGEDTDGTADCTPNTFQTINNISDLSRVVSVRLSLLLRTLNEVDVINPPTQFMLNGGTSTVATTITPMTDNRLRRVYSMTVKLRDRGD